MNWYHDFITLAVNSNRVVVVLVGCHLLRLASSRGELDVDVFTDSSGNHAFLLVTDLEVGSLGRQDMQPLWGWRVVDYSNFQSVGFVDLKACKLDDCWRSLEDPIRSDCIKSVMLRNRVSDGAFAAVDEFLLHLQNISRLRDGRAQVEVFVFA